MWRSALHRPPQGPGPSCRRERRAHTVMQIEIRLGSGLLNLDRNVALSKSVVRVARNKVAAQVIAVADVRISAWRGLSPCGPRALHPADVACGDLLPAGQRKTSARGTTSVYSKPCRW